jgi:hypothetical protein
MKRILLALPLLLILGCHAATSTTPPAALAPGFSSQADQTLDQILVGAHGFYTSIQGSVNAGTYTPSPTTLTALNDFGTVLNTADTVYLAYHNGTATLAQAQAAAATLQTQQATLQTLVTTGASQ